MIVLEQVSAQNLEKFKQVRLRALQDSPRAFGSTYAQEAQFKPEEWAARAARWNGERGIGYLAIDDGVACGIAGGLLHADDDTRADLVSMWIAPTHRQHGVGRMLVEAVIDWARRRGVLTLRLTVVATNDSAIRFYHSLGFSMTGRTEPYPNDPALLELEMQRQL